MWVIEVKDFPAVVTMDAHGQSLHAVVEAQSRAVLDELIS
jgi:fumarate hydratase class I